MAIEATSRARISFPARAFEVTVALAALLVALPLIVVLAVLSALTFRASPLFLQSRVGLGGRRFTLAKIRSLPPGTPDDASKYDLASVDAGWFARFIRRTHLDELPQLWLVVIGKMALVGPRPEMPGLATRFDAEFAHRRVSKRPGCTGLWQLSPKVDRLIGESPEYDLFYVKNANFRLDLWILGRTLLQFVRPSTNATLADIPRWTGCAPGITAAADVADALPLIDARVIERADVLMDLQS